MQALADTLTGLLGMQAARVIIPHRTFDLGTFESHSLFLVRGMGWDDGQAMFAAPVFAMPARCFFPYRNPYPIVFEEMTFAGFELLV
jgi:hypothetical protein